MATSPAHDRPTVRGAADHVTLRGLRLAPWLVAAYVAAWAVGGLVRDGYDPARQAISELFEVGSPWPIRGPLLATLVLSGAVFLWLAPVLHRHLPGRGRVGPILVAVAGLGTLGVVAAPCTPGCPGAMASGLDLGHTVAAGVGYGALVLAPLAVAWRVREHAPGLARWSAVIGAASSGLFLLHVVAQPTGLPGLEQRAFNTLADAWYVLVAVWLARRLRVRSPRGGGRS